MIPGIPTPPEINRTEVEADFKEFRRYRSARWRWQQCEGCSHKVLGLAVLHLQDSFTCRGCGCTTRWKYV